MNDLKMKRSFDIIACSIVLLVISPVLLLIAIIIKLNSSGPAFYIQTRIGKNRIEFRMIKFRSMTVDADRKGPLVTASGDSRITPIGRILRRTKLDELPELWNVLKGDMSLVGPRPEVPRYIEHYKPEWEHIFSVKPGITDLATLQFRDEEACLNGASDYEQAYIEVVLPIKMKLALEYVDKQSFWFDIKILLLTVWAISFGRIYAKPNSQFAKLAREKVGTYRNQQS